jgi:hypothetical protein
MPNIIQIKRSLTSAAPGSLANGEFAYTANGDILYLGSNGVVVPIGGKRVPGTLTANQALVANSTSSINEIRTALANVGSVYANGSLGTAGQILASNGTGVYWTASGGGGTVTSVVAANGLSGGTITSSGTISVIANSGVIANATGVFVNANNGIIANSTGVFARAANGISVDTNGINVLAGTSGGLVSNTTGVFVIANNGLVSNSTGLHVGTGNGITVSSDAIQVNPGSTLTVNSAGVHVNTALSITDLSLSGNLTVLGTTTSIDTNNLVVNDSIIELARNNAANILDIGFYGQYNDGTTRFTGLVWDTSAGNFELFANTTVEPTTTIDTAGVGYTRSTLRAFLNTGALVSNATNIAITGNSSVNVAIAANTLTLSTALTGVNGGTGLASFTSEDILVANTTNGFRKLALGTDGQVLQSNGTALLYNSLDGGTF